MAFKLLALDLDDSLLGADFQISPQNRQAILDAVQSGVLVTLATGRMYRSSVPFARELKIDLPLITYHGALIRTAAGEDPLYHRPVELQMAQQVSELAAAAGLHVNAYIDDELFVAKENELSRYYQNLAKVKVTAVGDLAAYLHTPPTKLTIINEDGLLDDFKGKLAEQFGEKLAVNISRPSFLEVTDCLATKGRALRFLAEKHGIPQSQVAAVGDSYNDLDMIIYAGLGVAVANARAEVKAVADVITSANTEHGVADFIYKYLFNGKDGGRHG